MTHATRLEAHDSGSGRDLEWQERGFDLLRGVAAYTASDLVAALARAVVRHPDARLDQAFNHKQIASKMWARDQLFLTLGAGFERIWIMGGWYGVLGAVLFDDRRFSVGEIVSYDVDPSVAAVAQTLNAGSKGRFRAVTGDMYAIDYAAAERPDLIINTSCEHLADLGGWLARLPARTAVLLQSNNYFAEPEHISCMSSLSSFERAAGLSELIFSGELALKKYTRFMLIGRK